MELVIASGSNVSTSLGQYFGYNLTDKKAKSNLLKSANREIFEIQERQKCVMMDLSTGAFLELIIPTVAAWDKEKGIKIVIENLEIEVEEVTNGYDECMKNVQSIVRFVVNNSKVVVTCYNTTQRIKVEGKGYQCFVEKFLKPLMMKKLSKKVYENIERYNKEVIAALSGKRKSVSRQRPMRSVRYKTMAKLSCSRCELAFKNEAILKKHKITVHTKGANDSSVSRGDVLLIEDASLLSDSDDELGGTKITIDEYLPIEHSEQKSKEPEPNDVTEQEEVVQTHNQDLLNDTSPVIYVQRATIEEHPQKSWKCSFCDFQFTTVLDLNCHIQREHRKEDVDMCTEFNSEDSATTTAYSNDTADDPVICCLCKFQSKDIEELRKHIENVHADNSVSHSLQDVFQSQVTKDELSARSNSNHTPINCNQCENIFHDAKTLKDHIDAKHTTHKQIDPFPCEWCGLYFSNFGLLEDHVQNYHGENSEHCHFCSEVFATLEELQAHMRQAHEDILILCTMAKTVETVNDKLEELSNQMKILLENNHAMKQEIFILRNNQTITKEHVRKKDQEPAKSEIHFVPVQGKNKPSPEKVKKVSPSHPLMKSPQKTQTQNPQRVNSKTLFVGDSISDVADFEALKEATETQIVHVKAYSAVYDTVSNEAKYPARFPHKNFTDVIKAALEKEAFENIIVQSGSVDITNLQTKKDVEKHFDYFHQQAVISATNTFSACENALKMYPSLVKTVIMKQIPRYDRSDLDPLSIKQALSEIFNNTLTDLWLNSPLKHKMFIGNHNLECTGGIRQSRYKNVLTGVYDGIHLHGSSGGKFFTKSALNILKQAGLIKSDYEHQNCSQAQYQSRQRGFKSTVTWPIDKDVRNKKSRDTYSIPLKNRFSMLSEDNLGNY